MHVTEGNMAETVQKHLPHIGNIQIADVPGHTNPEPEGSTMMRSWVLDKIDIPMGRL